MRAVAVTLALLVVAASGCLRPEDLPGGKRVELEGFTCPRPEEVTLRLNVTGAETPLERIVLGRASGYSTMLSCAAPPTTVMVAASGPAAAVGAVAARTYDEMRLEFERLLIVMSGTFPVTTNRSITIDVTDPWNVTFRGDEGSAFTARSVTVWSSPPGLEDHSAETPPLPLANGTHELRFRVDSALNGGIRVTLSLDHATATPGEARATAITGARIVGRLFDPDGSHVFSSDVRGRSGTSTHLVPAHEVGEWVLVVETTAPRDASASGHGRAGVHVDYLYG